MPQIRAGGHGSRAAAVFPGPAAGAEGFQPCHKVQLTKQDTTQKNGSVIRLCNVILSIAKDLFPPALSQKNFESEKILFPFQALPRISR